MYFHTDSLSALELIRTATRRAEKEGRRLRIDVDENGSLRLKIGEGMWTAPIASTPDPYRDTARVSGVCQSHTDLHYFSDECVGYRDAVAV